ncbi:MAG: hypothetical protein JXR91_14125 [Deltaproteobacteria bacterium]|nr:hypothetical protein [Deltaproteobacteria bacterium]
MRCLALPCLALRGTFENFSHDLPPKSGLEKMITFNYKILYKSEQKNCKGLLHIGHLIEQIYKFKGGDLPEKYPLSGSLIWPQWQQAYQEPNSGLG